MNTEFDKGQFERAQGATYAFLEGREGESVTDLRRGFLSVFGDVFDSPATMFYSSLSIMELQGALDVEGQSFRLTGDFTPVPPGDWHSVRAELDYQLDSREKDEFVGHFRKHFTDEAEIKLGEVGSRVRASESYGTGYSVSRELGHLPDLPHTWASIDVEVPVAYLTPDVKELVLEDLETYAESIAVDEYDTLVNRASGEYSCGDTGTA